MGQVPSLSQMDGSSRGGHHDIVLPALVSQLSRRLCGDDHHVPHLGHGVHRLRCALLGTDFLHDPRHLPSRQYADDSPSALHRRRRSRHHHRSADHERHDQRRAASDQRLSGRRVAVAGRIRQRQVTRKCRSLPRLRRGRRPCLRHHYRAGRSRSPHYQILRLRRRRVGSLFRCCRRQESHRGRQAR